MVCSKCGNTIPEGAVLCEQCSVQPGHRPRPGQKAYVSPEGIIHSTDGKYRWVYEENRWKDPYVLTALAGRLAGIGAGIGLVLLLFRLSEGTASAILSGLPLMLGLAACGALVGLACHAGSALLQGGSCCTLYTMDETMVSRQQVDGRADKQKVVRVVSEWVGGQSYPELTFKKAEQARFDDVRSIRPNRKRSCIRLGGAYACDLIRAEPQQMDFLLEHLNVYCPQASVKE